MTSSLFSIPGQPVLAWGVRQDSEATMEVKLVIIADLGMLKAYKLDRIGTGMARLELLEQIVLEEAHHRLVDKVTDLAGKRASPTRLDWGAPLGDAHNLELESQRRRIKEIADHIQRLSGDHAEWNIGFAAPRDINEKILESLPQSLRRLIQVIVDRDLIRADKQQLLQHFRAHSPS